MVPCAARRRLDDRPGNHSYVAALGTMARDRVLGELRVVVEARFPDSTMAVPYETWLWLATKV